MTNKSVILSKKYLSVCMSVSECDLTVSMVSECDLKNIATEECLPCFIIFTHNFYTILVHISLGSTAYSKP